MCRHIGGLYAENEAKSLNFMRAKQYKGIFHPKISPTTQKGHQVT